VVVVADVDLHPVDVATEAVARVLPYSGDAGDPVSLPTSQASSAE
jgi:hypothetical protein